MFEVSVSRAIQVFDYYGRCYAKRGYKNIDFRSPETYFLSKA